MSSNSFKIRSSAVLLPVANPALSDQGEMAFDSANDKIKVRGASITDALVQEALAATLTNKTIDAGSNTLSNITNASISASAAIAYSKLNLTSGVVNNDIAAAAGISYSKLATMAAGSVLLGSGSGVPTVTTLTGDVTVDATGVTAIGASKVTNTMLAGSIDLATKVTGVNAVANGGTGASNRTTALNNIAPATPAKGDLLVWNGSNWVVQNVGSNGQALVADSTQTNGIKYGTAATANAVVANVTTTFTASTTNDVYTCNANGAAFTGTLPTAVGNSGKIFQFKKTDSTLNQVTIAAAGAETIDGVASIKLNTPNEDATLVSNGTNWVILSRQQNYSTSFTPTWFFSSTGGGFGTVTKNTCYVERIGGSMRARYFFVQSTGGSAGASSFYTWSILSGTTIDTARQVVGTNGTKELCGTAILLGGGSQWLGVTLATTTTTVGAQVQSGGNTPRFIGNNTASFAGDLGSAMNLTIEYIVPITGWDQ